jgi:hypothetical protein
VAGPELWEFRGQRGEVAARPSRRRGTSGRRPQRAIALDRPEV